MPRREELGSGRIARGVPRARTLAPPRGRGDDPAMHTVVVLNQDQMGHGDRELGRRILATFLRKAITLDGLDAIVLYNSGVKLLAKDSPVLAELTLLSEHGVDLVPCGTCVQHFGLELATGKTSDMDTILRELSAAQKVITL